MENSNTPGVDTSAGKRLEALAGLAGGVQEIAVGIGKRAAEERGAEQGIEAGKAARTVDPHWRDYLRACRKAQ